MISEADNVMVWDGKRPGHYEVWYATFNHRPTSTGFWIRYTLESPLVGHGAPHATLWFAFFDARNPERNWAIHRPHPIGELVAEASPFQLAIGSDAVLRHDGMRGVLNGDAHSASWELAYTPCNFTHRHLPDLVYPRGFADTKVLSPNLIINLHGTVVVDGAIYTFDGDPGCQSHLWGRKHAHAWAWSHCNAFREDPTVCLETLSVRLRRGGLVLPTLSFVSLYLGSEVHHFRRVQDLPFTRASWETGLYHFTATNRRVKIEGELRCRPEDLVKTPYSDPDGEASFCHNTEVADCALTFSMRRSLASPFKRVHRLTSRGSAHFEYAARVPDGHVSKRHVGLSE
jgi:hypothetical protein